MRVLSAVLCAALLAGGCISNPDPREPNDLTFMQRQGYGGWIVVTLRDGAMLHGELLAVQSNTLYVLDPANTTQKIPLQHVEKAALYTYESAAGFGAWGVLGSLSTISHGFVSVFSFPIWVLVSSIAAGAESTHVRLRYPQDGVDSLAKWARFPQGMPRKAVPSKQEQAWALTKSAQGAARAGDCERVTRIDGEVRALDPGLHEVVFMRDVAIRRCLGLPEVTAPGATPPTTTPLHTAPPGETPPGETPPAPDAGGGPPAP